MQKENRHIDREILSGHRKLFADVLRFNRFKIFSFSFVFLLSKFHLHLIYYCVYTFSLLYIILSLHAFISLILK